MSVSEPIQSKPPLAGVGVSQTRVRYWVPSSHVAEHAAQSPHKLYPPLTEITRKVIKN